MSLPPEQGPIDPFTAPVPPAGGMPLPPPGYAAPPPGATIPPPPGYAAPPPGATIPPPPGYAAPPPSGYAPYGAAQPPYGYAQVQRDPATKHNWQGTTAMWVGVGSVVLNCFIPIVWIVALVFGIMGVVSANKGTATNKGQAIAGIVLSIVSLLVFVAIIVAAIASGDTSSSYDY